MKIDSTKWKKVLHEEIEKIDVKEKYKFEDDRYFISLYYDIENLNFLKNIENEKEDYERFIMNNYTNNASRYLITQA